MTTKQSSIAFVATAQIGAMALRFSASAVVFPRWWTRTARHTSSRQR